MEERVVHTRAKDVVDDHQDERHYAAIDHCDEIVAETIQNEIVRDLLAGIAAIGQRGHFVPVVEAQAHDYTEGNRQNQRIHLNK